MSLVGLIPPISDQGHLLVDGGYSMFHVSFSFLQLKINSVDNLPVSAMTSLGNSAVFACDVGSVRSYLWRTVSFYIS